jgi:hypothetical protein
MEKIQNEIKNYIESVEDSERFSEAIAKITPLILEYKDQRNIEVEFRIGYIDNDENTKNYKFETNIHSDFFNKIIKIFDHATKRNVFTKTITESTDFYNKENQRKTIINADKNADKNVVIIKKTRLCNIDFNFIGTPFDIRISFSRETPIKNFKENEENGVMSRTKYRRTFVGTAPFTNLFNYDITEVSFENNGLVEKSSEIEIEINKPLSQIVKDPQTACKLVHSSLLKLDDIAKICENDITNSRLQFVNMKKFN